jgi:hypothetical protein
VKTYFTTQDEYLDDVYPFNYQLDERMGRERVHGGAVDLEERPEFPREIVWAYRVRYF